MPTACSSAMFGNCSCCQWKSFVYETCLVWEPYWVTSALSVLVKGRQSLLPISHSAIQRTHPALLLALAATVMSEAAHETRASVTRSALRLQALCQTSTALLKMMETRSPSWAKREAETAQGADRSQHSTAAATGMATVTQVTG